MKRLWLFLWLSLFSSAIFAQAGWNEYKIRAINNQEKLPGKQVKQILQDSEGYMWFATSNGL